MWTVNLWDCEPGTDDACRTGDEFFESETEAREVFMTTWPTYFRKCLKDETSIPWLELLGPAGEREVRQNPAFVEAPEPEPMMYGRLPECHHLDWWDAVHPADC
jgi:hypothetical protein